MIEDLGILYHDNFTAIRISLQFAKFIAYLTMEMRVNLPCSYSRQLVKHWKAFQRNTPLTSVDQKSVVLRNVGGLRKVLLSSK